MATTAVLINGQKMLFMTVPREDGRLDVDIFLANEDYLPTGTPSIGVSPEVETEEVYHKRLRKDAYEKGHYLPEGSTDREWDPGGQAGENPG